MEGEGEKVNGGLLPKPVLRSGVGVRGVDIVGEGQRNNAETVRLRDLLREEQEQKREQKKLVESLQADLADLRSEVDEQVCGCVLQMDACFWGHVHSGMWVEWDG